MSPILYLKTYYKKIFFLLNTFRNT